MSLEFEFDVSKFVHALDKARDVIEKELRIGMEDALDEWRVEAVDVAPIDTGTLRKSISVSKIEGDGLNLSGGISANATVKSRRGRFNYAYYIHEHDAGGRKLRAPGTVKRFLAEPKERNEAKWLADIERGIQSGLDGAGW